MIDIIYKEIDDLRPEIEALSQFIHQNPETAFNEHKAAAFIGDMLKKHGFAVEKAPGGIETALKATVEGKGEGPSVAFLAEYDALPQMGHGCGHNLIAAASVGAALGLKKVMENLPGRLILMGTPAEEAGGGKIMLLQKGAFDDVDFSLMSHPGDKNQIGGSGLAITDVSIEFFGSPAHSSAPENGVNALAAVLHTFYIIDSMRGQMPLKANINGIITKGGTAPNIIPEYAKCIFAVRGANIPDLEKIIEMIKTAVEAAEKITKATAKMEVDLLYAQRNENMTIAEVYKKHLEALGEAVTYPDPAAKVGSSDIGNVMEKMPAIHPHVKISSGELIGHTLEFANAAVTDTAHDAIIKAAKALAATGYELLTNNDLRLLALEEHKKTAGKKAEDL